MDAYFTPGPLELIIVLVLGLICLAVPVALVIVILALTRKWRSSIRGTLPCLNCGVQTVPGARFCHQCGNALPEQQGP